jgi:hypothetical protein
MTTCWCGATHDPESEDPSEVLRAFGHQLLASLRIPELVAWLTRVLNR